MEPYLGTSAAVFFVLTVCVMGFAAFMTGQALANTWRPAWQVVVYCVLLGLVDRFLSFALFGVNVTALRIVTMTFSLLLAAAVYTFTYRSYSVAAARWATAIVAVAPMYFLQWNLKARGGFIEHVVLLFIVMILFWRFYLAHDRSRRVGAADQSVQPTRRTGEQR